jgi:hypothetical protein
MREVRSNIGSRRPEQFRGAAIERIIPKWIQDHVNFSFQNMSCKVALMW